MTLGPATISAAARATLIIEQGVRVAEHRLKAKALG
jgi:hypothetical protein